MAAACLVTMAAACAVEPGADATAEDLRSAFGACDGSPGEGASPAEFLVDTVQEWFELSAVEDAVRDPDGDRQTFPATFETSDGDTWVAEVHASYWPGIDWALANGAPVWIGLEEHGGDDYVATVMVQAGDGGIVFPGECMDASLDGPLHELLGDGADAVLAQLPYVDDAAARDLLGVAELSS
ncbi:hypothetical protein [Demequina gelatinilytica]|uniref:hypothetical protein n=1 Tax=Demequina gelatinilytica TaxID=1638980 RepID=UPI001E4D9F73|nr:hypothetical protein [Demequina gelatinilytica]